MDYEAAKRIRDAIEDQRKQAGAALQRFPRGAMGLTPDAIKASPEYRAAKAAYDLAHARLRKINQIINRHFSVERLADRRHA